MSRLQHYSYRQLRMRKSMPSFGLRRWESWGIQQKIFYMQLRVRMLSGQTCTREWLRMQRKKDSLS